MSKYRMQVQKPKSKNGVVYATLYDLTQPEGQQICCIGPIDTVADLLLGIVEQPEISMTYEN
jgi:hypothetical protein